MKASLKSRGHHGSRDRTGFTMIDMVLTVLIIGLLAAVAAPKYANSLDHFGATSAATHVAADIRYARQQARIRGRSQSVVFTPASDTYHLPGLDSPHHPGTAFDVDLTQTAYPATLVSADFGAGGSTVTFDVYGRPNDAGTVVIQVGATQRIVSVAAVSGIVSLLP